jgi:hypothetical protein
MVHRATAALRHWRTVGKSPAHAQEVIASSFNRSREVPLAHICSGIFRNYLFGLIALKGLEKSREVFCLIHGPESAAAQAVGLNKRGRRSKRGQQYNSQQPSGPQLCRHRRRTHLGGIACASNGPWDAGANTKALSEGRRQNLRNPPCISSLDFPNQTDPKESLQPTWWFIPLCR